MMSYTNPINLYTNPESKALVISLSGTNLSELYITNREAMLLTDPLTNVF